MTIPKIAHRIWFGEPFPMNYQENLKALAKLNPDYKVKLWSDPATMSEESYNQLLKLCNEENIQLYNVREHTELINYALIIEELDTSRNDEVHKRLHYVRASDIARIAILYNEGGIYTDTDSKMLMQFPEFSDEQSILLKILGSPSHNLYNFFDIASSSKNNYRYFFSYILYDFIASAPQTLLLKTTAEITEKDYETYKASNNRQWENSTHAEILRDGTIKLTGTALKWALNYLYQSGQICFDSPLHLFFNADEIIEAGYDKSWLEGFDKTEGIENEYLNRFALEIEEKRQVKYLINQHGEHPDFKPQRLPFIEKLFLPSTSEVFDYFQKNQNMPNLQLGNMPELKFKLPIFEVPKFQTSTPKLEFKFDKSELLTREKIYKIYTENNGGLAATFKIFYPKSKTPEAIIETLKERAKSNPSPNSASRKTLNKFNL
jgi:Glycosyltransferase sugar-binding region containing DXD motif